MSSGCRCCMTTWSPLPLPCSATRGNTRVLHMLLLSSCRASQVCLAEQTAPPNKVRWKMGLMSVSVVRGPVSVHLCDPAAGSGCRFVLVDMQHKPSISSSEMTFRIRPPLSSFGDCEGLSSQYFLTTEEGMD